MNGLPGLTDEGTMTMKITGRYITVTWGTFDSDIEHRCSCGAVSGRGIRYGRPSPEEVMRDDKPLECEQCRGQRCWGDVFKALRGEGPDGWVPEK